MEPEIGKLALRKLLIINKSVDEVGESVIQTWASDIHRHIILDILVAAAGHSG